MIRFRMIRFRISQLASAAALAASAAACNDSEGTAPSTEAGAPGLDRDAAPTTAPDAGAAADHGESVTNTGRDGDGDSDARAGDAASDDARDSMPRALVDIGNGLVYDGLSDVTWISDGLAFSKSIKATTTNPVGTPYTGPLLNVVVGTSTITESDFTFLSSMGDRWFASWYGATAWTANLSFSWGTHTIRGWRLPTLKELRNLYQQTGGAYCGSSGCDLSPGTVAPFQWIPAKVWTSTEHQYVDFTKQTPDLYSDFANTGYSNVWPVLAGNAATSGLDAGTGSGTESGLTEANVEDGAPGASAEDGAPDASAEDGAPDASAEDGAPDAPEGAGGLHISVVPGATAAEVHIDVTLDPPTDSVVAIAVSATPDSVQASANAATLTLGGLSPRTTHAFRVTATTGSGRVLTSTTNGLAFYEVVETFVEPMCSYNTIFTGSFTFDPTTKTVSNLAGILTEAMDEPTATVSLTHQLSTEPTVVDGIAGFLVTTFALTTTATFEGGTWAPGGLGRTYGNHNAYALVFVNTADPSAPLTSGQIDKLAYADCAPKGMMGKTCMTGTTVAGYGSEGTMSGYPTSQITTLR